MLLVGVLGCRQMGRAMQVLTREDEDSGATLLLRKRRNPGRTRVRVRGCLYS